MVKRKSLDFGEIRKHCRNLRSDMTASEIKLWKELRNRKLSGFKFLRQHPVIIKGDLIRLNYFVADFYCHEKKTLVELDGPIHESNKEYDLFRDSELKHKGYNVLRIKNEELVNIKDVLNRIESYLNSVDRPFK
jgi:very-short-patch-repair endonuclease